MRVINRSKSPYTKSDLIQTVFDEDFVEGDRYAKIIAGKIPATKRLDAFIAVFRLKETGDGEKLKFFFHELLGVMTEEEKQAALDVVQEELRSTSDETAIRQIFRITPRDCWENFDEAVRLRIENKLIKAIENGHYNTATERCDSGVFGTWISSLGNHLLLKDQLVDCVESKLMGSDSEKDYVFEYLFSYVRKMAPEPSVFMAIIINEGLQAGDTRFHTAIGRVMRTGPKEWQEPFKHAYEDFKESPVVVDDGITDDDVPF